MSGSAAGKKIVFLPRSTNAAALSEADFNSSSQAYEVALIKSLSAHVEVNVVDIGETSAASSVRLAAGLTYSAMGRLGIVQFARILSGLTKGCKNDVALITTGYFPFEILLLLSAQAIGVRACSIVYDTHLMATAKKIWFKKWLLNLYFAIGFALVKRLKSMIVLNCAFIGRCGYKGRVLVSRIGGLFNSAPAALGRSRQGGRTALIFAGTLNAENGVSLVLDALKTDKRLDVNIKFYGDGELADDVQRASRGDDRIEYFGRVSDSELDLALGSADFLICLRDPECIAASYSFPSKLIKFMGSGVPVIANIFPPLDEAYRDKLIFLDGFSATHFLAGVGSAILSDGHHQAAQRALDFIRKNNDWRDISAEMVDFLFA